MCRLCPRLKSKGRELFPNVDVGIAHLVMGRRGRDLGLLGSCRGRVCSHRRRHGATHEPARPRTSSRPSVFTTDRPSPDAPHAPRAAVGTCARAASPVTAPQSPRTRQTRSPPLRTAPAPPTRLETARLQPCIKSRISIRRRLGTRLCLFKGVPEPNSANSSFGARYIAVLPFRGVTRLLSGSHSRHSSLVRIKESVVAQVME